MFSLNVPLPGQVLRRIEAVRPALARFKTVRERPTLVVKRFGDLAPDEYGHVESEARMALAGTPTFEVGLAGLGTFEDPPAGPAPVVYLAIESPGLARLHARLVAAFGAVEGLEGDDYLPHVTLARGGDAEALDRLDEIVVEPATWTVSELWFWDARHGERAGRVSLPA